jgi:hypothetical protein
MKHTPTVKSLNTAIAGLLFFVALKNWSMTGVPDTTYKHYYFTKTLFATYTIMLNWFCELLGP